MSIGLVIMLLCLSMMQSSGGVSWFLKIFLCILFGVFCIYLSIFSYNFFDTFLGVFCGNCAGLYICCFGHFY